ncbi:MAG: hypothetical protein ACRD36_10025, partial [Candidatus Acidiferrum sp.]
GITSSAITPSQADLSVELLPDGSRRIPSVSVAAHTFVADLAAGDAASRVGAKQVARKSRWITATLFAISLVAALILGIAAAKRRHAAQRNLEPVAGAATPNAAEVESLLPPHDDEAALRQTADLYLAGGGKEVAVGLPLCIRLANFYLRQHRLDEADKLFTKLDNHHEIHSYHTVGHLGKAIVLAFRDKPKESNAVFRETPNWIWLRETPHAKGGLKRKADPELAKVARNPAFLYWLAQAVRYNRKNGVPDNEVPTPLLNLFEHKPKA